MPHNIRSKQDWCGFSYRSMWDGALWNVYISLVASVWVSDNSMFSTLHVEKNALDSSLSLVKSFATMTSNLYSWIKLQIKMSTSSTVRQCVYIAIIVNMEQFVVMFHSGFVYHAFMQHIKTLFNAT